MANRRLELHEKLKLLLGNANVYYQPPENLKMQYPCIRYMREDIVGEHADNITYRQTNRYLLTVISKTPDNPVVEKLLDLPMCSFDVHYVSDGLNHDALIIYY